MPAMAKMPNRFRMDMEYPMIIWPATAPMMPKGMQNRMHGLMREHWGRKVTGKLEELAEPVLYSTYISLLDVKGQG